MNCKIDFNLDWDVNTGRIRQNNFKVTRYSNDIQQLNIALKLGDCDLNGDALDIYFISPIEHMPPIIQSETIGADNTIKTTIQGNPLQDFGEWQIELVLKRADGSSYGSTTKASYLVVENSRGRNIPPIASKQTQATVDKLNEDLEKNITDGNVLKTDLDQSITNGNTANAELKASTQKAETAKKELNVILNGVPPLQKELDILKANQGDLAKLTDLSVLKANQGDLTKLTEGSTNLVEEINKVNAKFINTQGDLGMGIDKRGQEKVVVSTHKITSLNDSGARVKATEDEDLIDLGQTKELIEVEKTRAMNKEDTLKQEVDTKASVNALTSETARAKAVESGLRTDVNLKATKVELATKEDSFTKNSGFNLEKTDSITENDTDKVATSQAISTLNDKIIAETTRAKGIEGGLRTDVNGKLGATDKAEDSKLLEGKTKQEIMDEIVSKLVNGAPLTMDTFKEISDLITADGNALTALTALVAQKATKAQLDSLVKQLNASMGSLADLDTTFKASLVGAINEVRLRSYNKLETDKKIKDVADVVPILIDPTAGVSPSDDYYEGLVTGNQVNAGQGRTHSDKFSAIVKEGGLYVGGAYKNLVDEFNWNHDGSTGLSMTKQGYKFNIKCPKGETIADWLRVTSDVQQQPLTIKENTTYTVTAKVTGTFSDKLVVGTGGGIIGDLWLSGFVNGVAKSRTLTTKTPATPAEHAINIYPEGRVKSGVTSSDSDFVLELSITETDHEVPFIDGSFEGGKLELGKRYNSTSLAYVMTSVKHSNSGKQFDMYMSNSVVSGSSNNYFALAKRDTIKDVIVFDDRMYVMDANGTATASRQHTSTVLGNVSFIGNGEENYNNTIETVKSIFVFDKTDPRYDTKEKLEEILKAIKSGNYYLPQHKLGTTANIPFASKTRGDKGDTNFSTPNDFGLSSGKGSWTAKEVIAKMNLGEVKRFTISAEDYCDELGYDDKDSVAISKEGVLTITKLSKDLSILNYRTADGGAKEYEAQEVSGSITTFQRKDMLYLIRKFTTASPASPEDVKEDFESEEKGVQGE